MTILCNVFYYPPPFDRGAGCPARGRFRSGQERPSGLVPADSCEKWDADPSQASNNRIAKFKIGEWNHGTVASKSQHWVWLGY